MEVPSLELTLLNAVLIAEARFFIPAVAPKAIKATTRAYSTRSCASSRVARSWILIENMRSISFIIDLLVNAVFPRGQQTLKEQPMADRQKY
jgi:hypothetical protein